MSDKPVIFISHSSRDKKLALVLQEQIVEALDFDRNDVFLSTDPDAIPSGSDWFETIKIGLDKANALIVLVTASSMRSLWVGYEIGYFWNKDHGQYIYPLAAPQASLKGPIERLQGKSLAIEGEVRAFFHTLAGRFDVSLKSVDINSILKAATDIPQFATSPWLIEKKLDEFLMNQLELYKDYQKPMGGFESSKPRNNIFSGMSISYDELDEHLNLPIGSTKQHLIPISSRYGLVPEDKTDSGVRFKNNRKR